jgi:uncharacterized protein (TIGR02453 family)
MAAGFDGIPTAALDFYEDLEADNSKAFWTAHKHVYEESVRAPIQALVEALGPEFGPGKLFRPYRDVRFAKDKTPYKTHQGAIIQLPGRAGRYLHVDPAGLFVACGRWELSPVEVGRFRDLVDDERQGSALETVLASLRRRGYTVREPELQRIPSGYPKDHPRADLLRHKSPGAWRQSGAPDWLGTPRARTEVGKAWRAMGPMCDWLTSWLADLQQLLPSAPRDGHPCQESAESLTGVRPGRDDGPQGRSRTGTRPRKGRSGRNRPALASWLDLRRHSGAPDDDVGAPLACPARGQTVQRPDGWPE